MHGPLWVELRLSLSGQKQPLVVVSSKWTLIRLTHRST